MAVRSTTVVVLMEGRSSFSFEINHRLPYALLSALLAVTLMGATMRHCLDPRLGGRRCELAGGSLTGSLHSLRWPEKTRATEFVAAFVSDPIRRQSFGNAASLRALATVKPATLAPLPAAEPAVAGVFLRLNATHVGESLKVQPFDADGKPNAEAFQAVQHLMRCRISGEEAPIDPRLVKILAQLNALYDKPIQLVSGHRKPHVLGTKPTSQHALGRAADIRVPGVSIEALRSAAIQLGARGVGLYSEKGFLHVDVRPKARYFWTWSEDEGEEADLGLIARVAAEKRFGSPFAAAPVTH